MQVAAQTTNYQTLNAYQRPVTQEQPVHPVYPEKPTIPKPEYDANDVYRASNGNAIVDKDGNLVLTPEGELNVANAQQAKKDEESAQEQAKNDALRGEAVGYIGYQSKKSQVEIYLSVAANSKVDLNDGTATIIESLRETQKQNNAVEAYAQYQENQKGKAVLF